MKIQYSTSASSVSVFLHQHTFYADLSSHLNADGRATSGIIFVKDYSKILQVGVADCNVISSGILRFKPHLYCKYYTFSRVIIAYKFKNVHKSLCFKSVLKSRFFLSTKGLCLSRSKPIMFEKRKEKVKKIMI